MSYPGLVVFPCHLQILQSVEHSRVTQCWAVSVVKMTLGVESSQPTADTQSELRNKAWNDALH